ncbi:hypothetical protein THAOC_13209 [Thalassiosira oceanica]|uniref:t-SNARE coiled-coil homology domain-containing protein n=1 Tax=Thalassiosira oceanica TaxID=159749 RepID=K0SXZ3_THAOC|nr:hypothetical protein THAOC_13209 [Thalassiosira oceanica]|eukprot:EJK65891.1 hypothetical protein THAOC_13209 [Thalassiosira oceanica]
MATATAAAATHLGIVANWIEVLTKRLGGPGARKAAEYIAKDLGVVGPVELGQFNGSGAEMKKGEMLIKAFSSPPEKKVMMTGVEAGKKNFYMEPADIQPLTPMQQLNLEKLVVSCFYYTMVQFDQNKMYEPEFLDNDQITIIAQQMVARKEAYDKGNSVAFTTFTKHSQKVEALTKFRTEAERQHGASPWLTLGAYLRKTVNPRREALRANKPCCEDKTELLVKLTQVFKRCDDLSTQLQEFTKNNDVRGAFNLLKREMQSKDEHRVSYADYEQKRNGYWNPDALMNDWIGTLKKSIKGMDTAAAHLPEKAATLPDANKIRFLDSLQNSKDPAIISQVARFRTTDFDVTTLEEMYEAMAALDPNKKKKSVGNSGGAICSYTTAPAETNVSNTPKIVVGYKYPHWFRQQCLTQEERDVLDAHITSKGLDPKQMPHFNKSSKAKAWMKAKGGERFLRDDRDRGNTHQGGGGRGTGGRGGPGRGRGRAHDKRRLRNQGNPRDGSPEKKQRAQIAKLQGDVDKAAEASEQMLALVQQQGEQLDSLLESAGDAKATKTKTKKVTIAAVAGKMTDAGAAIRDKLRAVRINQEESA